MERVETLINRLHRLFTHNDTQQFKIYVPLMQGGVDAKIERFGKRDVRCDISSDFKLENGSINLKASSDSPCSVKFESNYIIPLSKSTLTICNDDRCPARISNLLRYKYRDIQFSSSQELSVKVIPLSTEILDRSLIDFSGKIKIMNRKALFRLACVPQNHLFSIEAMAYHAAYYGMRLDFDTNRWNLKDLYAVIAFEHVHSALSVAVKHNKSIDFVATTKIWPGFEGGLSIGTGLNNFVRMVGRLATKFKLDQTSSIHLIASSDKTIAGEFNVKYDDFFDMKFSGNLVFETTTKIQSKFGAVMTFDLSNK